MKPISLITEQLKRIGLVAFFCLLSGFAYSDATEQLAPGQEEVVLKVENMT